MYKGVSSYSNLSVYLVFTIRCLSGISAYSIVLSMQCHLIIIIIIRNLYSAIMPLGGYRGAGGTGR